MADSLDDFFAKKDKKRKNKNQSSVLSAETLVRELEEGSKQSEYSARRENKTSAAMELLGLDTNDNDWKDFEEIEKRDYTGLKVKEMSLQDQEEEHRRLNEKVEQVPETIPWKSKEDTVAAIISAREEVDVLSNEVAPGVADGAENADEAKDKPANEQTDDTKPETDGASTGKKETVSTSSDAQDQKEVKPTGSEKDSGTPADTLPKKEGETASKPAKYRPPAERLDAEVKQLEPVRLSKLISARSHTRGGHTVDIQDTKQFPTLG